MRQKERGRRALAWLGEGKEVKDMGEGGGAGREGFWGGRARGRARGRGRFRGGGNDLQLPRLGLEL